MRSVGRRSGAGERHRPGRRRQGGRLDVARRRGPLPPHLRAAPGRARRDPRPRRHRRAAGRAGPGHPAPALPDRTAEDLHGGHRARHRHHHARRLGRGHRHLRHVAGHPGGGPRRRRDAHGRDRAGAADGLGRQGRWPAPARPGAPGRRGRARAAARDGVPLRRRGGPRPTRRLPGRGGVLVGDLRPGPGRGPRGGARRRGAPGRPAPHPHRVVRRGRGPHARPHRPRRRAHARPGHARPRPRHRRRGRRRLHPHRPAARQGAARGRRRGALGDARPAGEPARRLRGDRTPTASGPPSC